MGGSEWIRNFIIFCAIDSNHLMTLLMFVLLNPREYVKPSYRLYRKTRYYRHCSHFPILATGKNPKTLSLFSYKGILQNPWSSRIAISVAHSIWRLLWNVMVSELAPKNEAGDYKRPSSVFRNVISLQEEAEFPLENDRYKLYVGLPCPWCHRVLLALVLCNLTNWFSIEYCEANIHDGAWQVRATGQSIRAVYRFYEPGYRGRCTLPLLVDTKQNKIVNHESSDIVHFLVEELSCQMHPSTSPVVKHRTGEERNALLTAIHEHVNNGVYRAGFAQTQESYEKAMSSLMITLNEMETRLERYPFLDGNEMTIADIYLFPTIYRFDAIYGPLFKCNLKIIPIDYPHIFQWLKRIYAIQGVAATCDLEETKQSYYRSLFPLNPSEIVPLGPQWHF